MLLNAKFVIKVNLNDVVDLTEKIRSIAKNNDIQNASVVVHSPFSYTSVGVMEYNPALVKDFLKFISEILPNDKKYLQNIQWKNDFAEKYLKSLIVGNSVVVPFINGEFELDRFQRILLFDFSSKQGARSVIIQMIH